MTTLALFLLMAAVATPLLHRDLERADRRRRMRLLTAPMRRAFEAMRLQIGLALLPAMRDAVRAASEMDAAMRKVHAALTNQPSGLEALRKRAQDMRETR